MTVHVEVAFKLYLHSEEGDAGQEVHSGLEILQTRLAASWEVILSPDRRRGSRRVRK